MTIKQMKHYVIACIVLLCVAHTASARRCTKVCRGHFCRKGMFDDSLKKYSRYCAEDLPKCKPTGDPRKRWSVSGRKNDYRPCYIRRPTEACAVVSCKVVSPRRLRAYKEEMVEGAPVSAYKRVSVYCNEKHGKFTVAWAKCISDGFRSVSGYNKDVRNSAYDELDGEESIGYVHTDYAKVWSPRL